MNSQTTKRKIFMPLTLKLLLAVLASVLGAFIIFELLEGLKGVVARKYYLSDQAVMREVNNTFDDFTDFVNRRHIKSTDTELLQEWIKESDYTTLTIFDNYTISFDGGWSVTTASGSGDDITEDQVHVNYDEELTPRITPDTFEEDVKNRIITFDDGKYYVYINTYKEQHLYRIFNVLEIALCVSVVIGTLLVYNARLMNRITKVAQYAQNVADGDLSARINATANDEVGHLAADVDTMRASLIKRLMNEKEAWDKNSELITAMSHDIRTPLTSLIGYLDIIESGKYQSQEEALKYVSASREKAFQLKDLSDKLFQYFLVFGSHSSQKDLEVYDADILIQQLISEHSAELMSHGFRVEFNYGIAEGVEIEAEVSGLRRLFDNIFSNVMKYADKNYPVSITVEIQEKNILITMVNKVMEDSRNVESNKIGLKTCEKICKDAGGDFIYTDDENGFSVKIALPTYESKQGEKAMPEEGLAGLNVHDLDLESLAETIEQPDENVSEVKEQPDIKDQPDMKEEFDSGEQDER